jgi:hypothetical protein
MIHLIFAGALALSSVTVLANESMSEKASGKAGDAKRAIKKGAHRAGEAVCMEGDAKCLAKKAKNRVEETKDYGKDKAIEAKDAVDADGKAHE